MLNKSKNEKLTTFVLSVICLILFAVCVAQIPEALDKEEQFRMERQAQFLREASK